MGIESQGDFLGDDLGSDPEYLEIEAKSDLKHGLISRAQFRKRMERIQRIAAINEERDW